MRKVQPVRVHHGVVKTTNKENKALLMKDFNCRCGYCNDHHRYVGGVVFYHLDHFAPKSMFDDHKWDYDNMVYSCPYCNISKSNKWESSSIDIPILNGKGFVDPCKKEYTSNFIRKKDGAIIGVTDVGKYMVKELRLDLALHKYNYLIDNISEKLRTLGKHRYHKIVDEKVLLEAFYLIQDYNNKKDEVFSNSNMYD